MTSLLFVVPAWQRFELSEICFRQLRQTCDALCAAGLRAEAVVIADDENLDLASAQGFRLLERDNEFLSRRFNDGYELALEEDFAWVHARGSDMWEDPECFLALLSLGADECLVGRNLAAFMPASTWPFTGTRRVDLDLGIPFGSATYPVSALRVCGGRPMREDLPRSCDAATRRALAPHARPAFHSLHSLERINFSSAVHVTDWQQLASMGHVSTGPAVWDDLPYPPDLVAAVREFYESGRAATLTGTIPLC